MSYRRRYLLPSGGREIAPVRLWGAVVAGEVRHPIRMRQATIEQRMSMRTALGLIRRSFGSYDPAYVPRFVRRLDPPRGRCLLAVKGWFAHGRGSMQREPWLAVEVWCDGKLVGVLSQGLGRASQPVAPLTLGPACSSPWSKSRRHRQAGV